MEGKTGRTKGKENTCRTVGITKALADSGHSTARKGFFYFFALKFGYSIETKNPNASPIRKVFGLFVCGRSDRIRTCGLLVPNQAHYQAVPHPVCGFKREKHFSTTCPVCQVVFAKRHRLFYFSVQSVPKIRRNIDRRAQLCYNSFISARAGLFFARVSPAPVGRRHRLFACVSLHIPKSDL